MNKNEICLVFIEENQHSVHQFRGFAVTQQLKGEKPTGSLGKFKSLQQMGFESGIPSPL